MSVAEENTGHAVSLPARPIADRYVLHERVARGAMGTVYRATDRISGDEAAIKRIAVEDPSRYDFHVAAFEREYRVLAAIDHPYIVRAFDYGVDADGPYYAMEYVRGDDVGSLSPMAWPAVCNLMRQLASALALLHARGLLHRDISPNNVKVRADGRCLLLDFGALVNFGVHSMLVGTPPMVPPEALRGEPLDGRADLYALGALAYWMLTRKHAYPAAHFTDLPSAWEETLLPPSALVSGVPRALDQLVLALLNRDPLARPSSAAQVIARLTAIGELAPETESDRKRIAQSFLTEPPFVGREQQLDALNARLVALRSGAGAAVRVEGIAGSGRTRLLSELSLRARLLGVSALGADSAMHPEHQGTLRALAVRLLDTLPDLAREQAKGHVRSINALGRDIEERLHLKPSRPPSQRGEAPLTDGNGSLCDWLVAIAQIQPLVVVIDNVEVCDAASLAVLAQLSSPLMRAPLLLVVSERLRRESARYQSLAILRQQCDTLAVAPLVPAETQVLARALFGDVPDVERFADWLHGRTAGNPLHIVELSRQLIDRDAIHYEAGLWRLPAGRPQLELPDALEEALSFRLDALSEPALALARLLSLQRRVPSLEWCAKLCAEAAGQASLQQANSLLEELTRQEILRNDAGGFQFVSSALRETLLGRMTESDLQRAHARLGAAFESERDLESMIEAGWHFMLCNQELRGADLVVRALGDPNRFARSGYQFGPAAEAALSVYKKFRIPRLRRLPLLSALCLAGYLEHYDWSWRYADEALDLIEELSGLHAARSLRRFLGTHLGLGLAMLWARVRHLVTPRSEKAGSFMDMLRQCVTGVVSAVGTASVALDTDRAQRITNIIAPFSALPKATTPRLIYDLCRALLLIGREHHAAAAAPLEDLRKRMQKKDSYALLGTDERKVIHAGVYYGRCALAVFRAERGLALESLEVLEASEVRAYAPVARQLRALLHANHGENAQAAVHRREALQLGGGWQVELWEPAALLTVFVSSNDVVALSRVVDRMAELERSVPSIGFYRRLGSCALELVRNEGVEARGRRALQEAQELVAQRRPRDFIGWTASVAYIAATYNRIGQYEVARAICEQALTQVTDEDRDYVSLFLELDIQTALADSGLGKNREALARVDGLLARFEPSAHAFALGLLHEARARISHASGDLASYRLHLVSMESWLRPLRNPALVAKCEHVASLADVSHTATPPLERDLLDEVATDVLGATRPGV